MDLKHCLQLIVDLDQINEPLNFEIWNWQPKKSKDLRKSKESGEVKMK
jgi:hypothetical protein